MLVFLISGLPSSHKEYACVSYLFRVPLQIPSTLLQPHICLEKLTSVNCIHRLLYPPYSGWVPPVGKPGGRSGEKRRVGGKLCLSTKDHKGHNSYQRCPLFMTLSLKFPTGLGLVREATAPAVATPPPCGSPIPSFY